MALYSIKQETLTNIGDALRRKHGETKTITVTEEVDVPSITVSASPNSTSFTHFGGLSGEKKNIKDIVTIPSANSIHVKIAYRTMGAYNSVSVYSDTYSSGELYTNSSSSSIVNKEFTFEGTDTITFYYSEGYASTTTGVGYYAECTGYDADGNVIVGVQQIEVEKEVKNTYKSSEMAQAIDDILPSPPEEAFVISGDCFYRFYDNGWNWFIEQFGNKITTKDITNAQSMFYQCNKITEIPFDLNFSSSASYHSLDSIFKSCSNITKIPKLNNVKVYNTSYMFTNCYNLREIPDNIADTWDWSYIEKQTSKYTGSQSSMFSNCYSLRSVPINLIKSGNPYINYNYNYFYNGFNCCYTLDELINLPIPYTKATWTDNAFYYAFVACSRLKNITFALNNGVPYTVTWKSQVIDLSNYVGYTNNKNDILNYNSGITADKQVTDNATYQALKNDHDWFTTNVNYSRYNHDSAVATINSLPDTSAYLATAGGTNTIKFNGAAGASTDGGAINTLTEEEIAVAAAKGWTVTLV